MREGEQPPWMVSDDLWARVAPLLPVRPRRLRSPGRRRLPDRQVLCGILFVLHTGIQWEFLPRQLGFGSGMTCWRRLQEWNEAGVWARLHEVLLAELHAADRLGWSRTVVDSSHVRAARRGPKAGPSPVDRARPGSRHNLIIDAAGIPLAVVLTGGNRNDVIALLLLLAALLRVRGRRGRSRSRPASLYADRGYDHDPSTARWSTPRQSARTSPAAARRTGPGWASCGGSWNAPSPGIRLVSRHETSTHPLGTPRRHARGVPQPRHLHHHLPPRPPTLLGPLSPMPGR
jgi:transposase